MCRAACWGVQCMLLLCIILCIRYRVNFPALRSCTTATDIQTWKSLLGGRVEWGIRFLYCSVWCHYSASLEIREIRYTYRSLTTVSTDIWWFSPYTLAEVSVVCLHSSLLDSFSSRLCTHICATHAGTECMRSTQSSSQVLGVRRFTFTWSYSSWLLRKTYYGYPSVLRHFCNIVCVHIAGISAPQLAWSCVSRIRSCI